MPRTATKKSNASAEDTLTNRQILSALRALKRGDFTHRLPETMTGIEGQIADVYNEVAERNDTMRAELHDLRTQIETKGSSRARMKKNSARGGWADSVESINGIVSSLAGHSQEIVDVISSVANGDLEVRVETIARDDPLQGIFLKHAESVNLMVGRLSHFADEVTRVAREVGTEGRLGAQAEVPKAFGAWRELTDNVNLMASNLTNQVREIAQVTTAVAQGDLTKSVNIQARGEIHELKTTINTMVEQLSSFADEVTRVAREVGSQGILGGQAQVRGVSGVWKELTDNVNSMANNLTGQVRNIAEVATAIANGDLSRKITVEVSGEMLELKSTINRMVEQLGSFADEVTRVAREVGTEGVLGGEAEVSGVSGVWRELTENVNSMADNLTGQVRNIAEVITAIANGDLSRKITVDAQGEILLLKTTINETVDKLSHFGAEVTRVARLVGTEGTLGVQADIPDVSGIWRELTDNVNTMGRNLTDQVRDIADVTTAVANGDLSRKITVEARGELLALKNTINAMVDSLASFSSEVTRMARQVGIEGVLGGQAEVRDVLGIWRELTENVNVMAENLTDQVRNIAEVASAVAGGDLSKKITVDARGEVLDLKNTINGMVDQLNSFGAEVSRVAREVGVEGKLGGQARVEDARGIWHELTDNVNLMASNLTDQVRDIADVTTAVAKGDLSRKILVDARGEILELKNTVNTMVDQLRSFADEVTRLASEVGIEGRLGGQADVRGVSGTWRDLTDAVNSMASNLTNQVRNISQVASAIAEGDLDKKIVVDARGEILELKNTINTMVDQLGAFAAEVTRVAREVGTEGMLGGQASVEGVRGTWKELTNNVNLMATNLTNQVRDIATVATAIAQGDLSRKVTAEVRGEILELKNTINTMVDQLGAFADEVTRMARDVGVEGKLGGQAEVRGASGIWRELTDNVNLMGSNLTNQVRDIAQVTTAVANGDLTRKITVEVRGELLELKNTINTMVDQLGSFADEVTRVAREVGTKGTLGGQAEVRGLSGTWRELTDNVNLMARNLTEQVRGIATVVTSVANGDLSRRLTLDARGEIAALVETINDMTGTLLIFADQVTGVARDVGVEGRLGGQADVPGAAGIWHDLTTNVNELAGNLTRQVRAIGDVATAVTKGDLTQSIDVEARGEVAALKDNLNQMIRTLAHTTTVNQEQDWLKTNLTRFTRMLQGQRDLLSVSERVLSELCSLLDAKHGAFFMMRREDDEEAYLALFATFAYVERKNLSNRFEPGQGLIGQAALEKKRIMVTNLPPDYVKIGSALGEARPTTIAVCPVLFEDEVKGVIELAGFENFTSIQLSLVDQLLESLGIVVATIEANMRTDDLLRQSQGMAEELQTQQEELQQTNEELEQKAVELTQQRDQVERKNSEVELARQELEEKAEQLALTSKYKSQFLANMSHELRTPLNSLLILSRQLAENRAGNLDEKQVEYATAVHQAGVDLLSLINEILDLAKVESGTMAVNVEEVSLESIEVYVRQSFQQVAQEKGVALEITIDHDDLPDEISTDDLRLRQVLRNLLSNAFKFTADGSVTLIVRHAAGREWSMGNSTLDNADDVIVFAVRDTGIGIPKDKQGVVFEAFQQADGSTSRKYGGTGLGLSISREIATLLGGELTLDSTPGVGSTFSLFLPAQYRAPSSIPSGPVRPALPARTESRPSKSDTSKSPTGDLPRRSSRVNDDRGSLEAGDRVLLIIEDDLVFAETMADLAHEHGFKTVITDHGEEALDLALELEPDAITLDLMLPDMDGWVLLDRLKHDAGVRHIPVHVISASGDEHRALEQGAVEVLQKPLERDVLRDALTRMQEDMDRRVRRLLVVEDDERQRTSIEALIGNGDVETVAVATGEEALQLLQSETFDCLVIDLRLPGLSGLEVIRRLEQRPSLRRLPVIVYTGQELEEEERRELDKLTQSVIIKDVKSPERLLDETALFLHRVEQKLPEAKRKMLRRSIEGDPALAGKRVLVVDDDMRNVFALTAILEQHNVDVSFAENGREALEKLQGGLVVDAVLMDIMMPEMDGYEATRRLRKDKRFRALPIIALTAKAMKGDRDKCLEAGCSDYVTKPIDQEQLVSLLRAWTYR